MYNIRHIAIKMKSIVMLKKTTALEFNNTESIP
jgi:hypothetical protein